MRIQNNIMAINSHRQYGINNTNIAKSIEKLSSGYRVNRAGDDAAGLAISEKMRAQIRGLNMASKNSQDAISLVQTAEGALQSTHNILQRMRELAVQAASDTNEQVIDRGALQQEFAALKAEIDDTAAKTRFNDQNLIDGTFQSVKNTATMTGALVGSVSLANKAQAGVYNFEIIQSTTGDVVGELPQNGSVSSTSVGTGIVAAAAGNAVDVSAISQYTDSFNGTWRIGYNTDTGLLEAKNTVNGKVLTASIDTSNDLVANDTIDILFGGATGLKVTLTVNGTFNLDSGSQADIDLFGAGVAGTLFDVSGGITPVIGETKFYATLDGANSVEVRAGDKGATFNNGITFNFSNALTFADLTRVVAPATDSLDHADDSAFTLATYVSTVTVIGQKQSGLIIQTGANEHDELQITIDEMSCRALNILNSSVSTRSNASRAITEVNDALNEVSTQRAALGALQNRLEFKISNLDTSAENLQAAESRIRDLDMAKEMTTFTKNNILAQAATAMLAQANALPQGVLQLLK